MNTNNATTALVAIRPNIEPSTESGYSPNYSRKLEARA